MTTNSKIKTTQKRKKTPIVWKPPNMKTTLKKIIPKIKSTVKIDTNQE